MINCLLWPVRMAFQIDAPEKEKLFLKKEKKKNVLALGRVMNRDVARALKLINRGIR